MYQNNAQKFYRVLDGLERDPQVCRMKQFTQHKGNPTFWHCHNVAVASFRLAQKLGWRIDEVALARGAMLHDFHLYTREKKNMRHLFEHPRLALRNAEQTFTLSGKEKNIIASHMWPLTVFAVPRSKEAVLVTLADKYCAFREMRGHRRVG
ncbi:MAG: HD domain-containing protein [Oscillospiraceae bacterium]|nr:HD domain-containing protein [Oscillospiraceae bacterium]